jgi:hypothetical protein
MKNRKTNTDKKKHKTNNETENYFVQMITKEKIDHPNDFDLEPFKKWNPSGVVKYDFVINGVFDLIQRYKIFQDDPKVREIVKGVIDVDYWINKYLNPTSKVEWDVETDWVVNRYFILLHLCLGDPNSREYKELYERVTEGVEGGEIKEEERDWGPSYSDNPEFLRTPKISFYDDLDMYPETE